jgi:hypothetical protein
MPTISVSQRDQLLHRPLDLLAQFRNKCQKFFFPSSSDKWLAILRIGLGLQVEIYCFSLRSDWSRMFAGNSEGLISRDLMEAILAAQAPLVPRLGWLTAAGNHLGLSEETVLTAVWIGLVCAGGCLVLGLFCRGAAIVAWFLYLCAVKSGNLLTYGVDNFTTIGLFYLMLAPFPDRYALDRKLWNSPIKDRHLHGFFRRVLQLHLCLIYFFSGLAKCLGTGWWNGENMWRALTRPPFNVVPVHIVISWQALLPLAGIAVWTLEMGYPFLIWPRKTRAIWLVGVLAMHVAIGLTMGLYLFALIMIILNVAAFGSDLTFGRTRSPRVSPASINDA